MVTLLSNETLPIITKPLYVAFSLLSVTAVTLNLNRLKIMLTLCYFYEKLV